VKHHAKASSAGSIEGSGNSRGFFRRAFATRGASDDANGSGARSRGWTVGLLAALTATIFALTSAPAFAALTQTLDEDPTPAYTAVEVTGMIDSAPGAFTVFQYEASTDGVNFQTVHLGYPHCPPGTTATTDSVSCANGPSAPPAPADNRLENLKPGTHYYFRLHVSRSPDEGGFSNVVEATTLPVAKPSVISIDNASEVSYVTAKVTGSVEGVDGPSPADFDANCRFEYVTDAQFGSNGFEGAPQVPCNPNPVVGSGSTPVEASLTELKPGTTYHLRLTASNAGGSDTKVASTFTTLPVDPPAVLSVNDAANVEYSKAELSGEVERPANPDPAFDAQCRFEYVSALDYDPRGDTQGVAVRATGGTFKLSFDGQTTAPIEFDASAAEVQLALEALSSIGSGSVSVTGGPGDEVGENPYRIVFTGALGGKDLENIAVDGGGLAPAGESGAGWQFIADGHGAEGFNRASTIPCSPDPVITPGVVTAPGPNLVTANLTGLEPGTTYHYRLAVSNAGGSDTKEAVNTFTTLVPGAPAVSILPPSTVTASSAHLAGTINPDGTDPGFNVNWHFRCTPKCPGIEGGTIAADESTHEVSVDATGLKANTSYSVVLIATNAAAKVVAGPELFTTAAAKPVVTTFPAFALAGGTEALVGGKVDPENSATTYWIEYGSDNNYGASIPLSEDGDAGAGDDPKFVTEEVDGLQPSTTYHFRLVATNPVGTQQGADKTFTTAPPGGLGSTIGGISLPDNRHWEMVSPVPKNGMDLWKVKAQASASGDAFAFVSQGSFADQPTAKGAILMDYLSTRGSTSWTTHGIVPPKGRFSVNEPGFHEYSDDLRFGNLLRFERNQESLDPEVELDPSDPNQYARYYIRDNSTGEYKLAPGGYVAASTDFSHIALQSGDELTPDGCTFFCVYEKAGSETKLVSRLPDGNFEYGQFAGISKDGSRIYWTSFLGGHLYARVDGTSTVQIDESERTVPPVGGGEGMTVAGIDAPSGERAIFVTPQELVDADEDSANDLYVWDGTKPEGQQLTLVSQGDTPGLEADFGQVIGSGQDRRAEQSPERGYFYANNQIMAGEPNEPGRKIYFWEAAGGQPELSYVATQNSGSLNTDGAYSTAHTSPDGRYMAFVSSERLTAYDNSGKQEIYRYDGGTRQLVCISCDPEGRPATGGAAFNSITEAEATYDLYHVPRNVSDSGRAFFETSVGLVRGDSNGQIDVYEYYQGAPHLLSSGRGPEESRFYDASLSGGDVFFSTTDRLVGWDPGNDVDAYDARVNGGLPEPPAPPIGCEGDSCQPAPTPPNDPTPASANFSGAGNVPPPKKARNHHKKKHKKKRQQAKKRHGAPATRSHG
jgi:hypothetical protein